MTGTYPELAEKVAIVTGGLQGIGRAVVDSFVAQGMKVGVVDIAEDHAQSAARALRTALHVEVADFCDDEAGCKAVADCVSALRPPTVLVNNAARDDRHGFDDLTT